MPDLDDILHAHRREQALMGAVADIIAAVLLLTGWGMYSLAHAIFW